MQVDEQPRSSCLLAGRRPPHGRGCLWDVEGSGLGRILHPLSLQRAQIRRGSSSDVAPPRFPRSRFSQPVVCRMFVATLRNPQQNRVDPVTAARVGLR